MLLTLGPPDPRKIKKLYRKLKEERPDLCAVTSSWKSNVARLTDLNCYSIETRARRSKWQPFTRFSTRTSTSTQTSTSKRKPPDQDVAITSSLKFITIHLLLTFSYSSLKQPPFGMPSLNHLLTNKPAPPSRHLLITKDSIAPQLCILDSHLRHFSYTHFDWFIKWQNSPFDQSVGSFHGLKVDIRQKSDMCVEKP